MGGVLLSVSIDESIPLYEQWLRIHLWDNNANYGGVYDSQEFSGISLTALLGQKVPAWKGP